MPPKKVVKNKKVRKPRTPPSTSDTPRQSKAPANAFKPGNQLWKQRQSHGRDYLFANPAKMWESAQAYFQWCDNNPLERNEPIKFEGMMTVEPVEVGRPYTLTGLCFWFNCSENYFRRFDYDNAPPDLVTVVECILQVIRENQLTGAAVNIFNGPIVSKLQELVDRSDVTTNGKDVGVPSFNIISEAPEFAKGESSVNKKRDEK